jgi:hypothetical protein
MNDFDPMDERKALNIPFQRIKLPEDLKRDIFAYLIPQKQSFKFAPDSVTQALSWATTSVKEPERGLHARDINSTGDWLVVINREPNSPVGFAVDGRDTGNLCCAAAY